MSSNGGNKKSMDDVLSSIRQIIGNESEDSGGPAKPPAQDASKAPPLQLGDPVVPGVPPAGSKPPAASGGGKPAEPLSLTPNMRADKAGTDAGGSAPLSLAGMEAAAPPPRPEASPVPAGGPASGVDNDEDTVVIDEAALEDMIRRIVREELASAIENDSESDDQMRKIVRDELMGETGQNISRNVQAMIRTEVERLLSKRGL